MKCHEFKHWSSNIHREIMVDVKKPVPGDPNKIKWYQKDRYYFLFVILAVIMVLVMFFGWVMHV